MKAKQKAIELVTKFLTYSNQFYPDDTKDSKQCALIAVDLVIEVEKNIFKGKVHKSYWEEVKKEIELL